jgi:hypothetical protein
MYNDLDTTITSHSEYNQAENNDQSQFVEFSEYDDYLPGEGCASQRRQELAEELMREHMERKRRSKSKLNRMFDKFLFKR